MSRKIAIGVVALAVPFGALAAPESYTLDSYHTFPNFEINHNGMSNMRGHFSKTAGKFTIDRAAKAGSLDITIQAASISTGDNDKGSRPRARDEHLRTPDFFNVAEFPTLTYKATSVKFNGDNPATIEGNMTLLGVTKPVPLHVEYWKCGPHPLSKKEMCGGNVSGSFKRTDFGMKYGVPNLSDEVKLYISMEAYKD